MKPGTKIETTAGCLAAMTDEQFHSLQQNILSEGTWEHLPDDFTLRVDGGEYLGVYLPSMFVGIETDGYTHS